MNAPANVSTRISQPDLVNHGFKRAMGNAASGYILLSNGPASESGRKIYVEGGEVAHLFASLILSRGSHKKATVLSWLSRLRSTAGGFQAFSNKRSGFEHMEVIEDMRICYVILQTGDDQGLSAGVYITDIELAEHAEDHKPGLYHVAKEDDRWRVDDRPRNSVSTLHAAINGLAESIDDAASNIMPGIIDAVYKDDKPQLNSNGYTLAYNPSPLYRRSTEWSTPDQKTTSADFTATLLAKALYDTQMQNREVKWSIHGDGAILLLNALEKLPKQLRLNKHTLFFAAPAPVMTKLLHEAKQRQMNLAKDVMKYQTDDWRSVTARTWHQWRASEHLKIWGEDYSQISSKLAYQAEQGLKAAGKQVMTSFAAGGSIGGVVLAIASGVSPATAIYAAVGAGTAFSVWANADTYRNVLAAYNSDSSVNPHMNPMLSSDDFNLKARAKYGGKMKSLIGMIKDIERQIRGRS